MSREPPRWTPDVTSTQVRDLLTTWFPIEEDFAARVVRDMTADERRECLQLGRVSTSPAALLARLATLMTTAQLRRAAACYEETVLDILALMTGIARTARAGSSQDGLRANDFPPHPLRRESPSGQASPRE